MPFLMLIERTSGQFLKILAWNFVQAMFSTRMSKVQNNNKLEGRSCRSCSSLAMLVKHEIFELKFSKKKLQDEWNFRNFKIITRNLNFAYLIILNVCFEVYYKSKHAMGVDCQLIAYKSNLEHILALKIFYIVYQCIICQIWWTPGQSVLNDLK